MDLVIALALSLGLNVVLLSLLLVRLVLDWMFPVPEIHAGGGKR